MCPGDVDQIGLGRTVLYIGRAIPSLSGHASEVVIARHLAHLQKLGFRVKTAVPRILQNKRDLSGSFEHITVRGRSWWWPPMRFGWNRYVWRYVWSREIHTRAGKIDAVLTHLHPPYYAIADELARIRRVPWGMFVHDQPAVMDSDQRDLRKMLRRCRHCWCVSRELSELMQRHKCESTSILLPVPSSNYHNHPTSNSSSSNREPRLAVIGTVYNIPLTLECIIDKAIEAGLKLTFIASPTNELAIPTRREITTLPFFPKLEDCLEYVRDSCTAVLIPYPMFDADVEKARFLEMSFPSRLLEFSKCGLPIKVIARENFSISRWCRKNFPQIHLNSIQELSDWFCRMGPHGFAASSEGDAMLSASRTMFSAEFIQREFTESFLDKLRR